MVSTFHGLELGKRGLFAGQTGISTAGHNIANANTKGYSRQQVNLTTAPSIDIWTGNGKSGQLGMGVSVESITRIRDRFLDEQYREQSGTLAGWKVKQDTLSQLETIIGEPSEYGLSSIIDQYWSAWQDVVNDPDSQSAQAVLKERAQAFVDTFQTMDNEMTQLTETITNQIMAKEKEANELLEQIAQLNGKIQRMGTGANDLLDQRDVLVEQLSKIVPIDVKEQTNGSYTITLAGTTLVDGATANEFISGEIYDSGELSGLHQSLDIIKNNQTTLSTMVQEFVTTISGDGDFNKFIDTVPSSDLNVEDAVQTIQDKFRTLVSEVGAESQTVSRNVAANEATLLAIENRRQSVIGVSLDEEMTNLIKFQHAYNAAARIVSTTDEMLDTIINRMAAR